MVPLMLESKLIFCFTIFIFFKICFSEPSSPIIALPIGINEIMDMTTFEFQNYTRISEPFRTVNRRPLTACDGASPYLYINIKNQSLSDDGFVTVHVGGVLKPSEDHWVAMITPAHEKIEDCYITKAYYAQTGDLSSLPLLCHYPVKAQYVRHDPDFMDCRNKECQKYDPKGKCTVYTCSASLSFRVINIRTDIEFALFDNGFVRPCLLKRSDSVSFSNPKKPLYGHLSSTDSSGTSMRLTWVSGDKAPQQVQFGAGKSETSKVTTFSRDDMSHTLVLPSPAKDCGWHDPGYIHSAVMTQLEPSTIFSYRYGSDLSGWSDLIRFQTPPAGGSDELHFLAFGDMGKTPLDSSIEHYIQPGAISVVKAMTDEISKGNIDSIFHIGDISYATGFLVEWDFFLSLIHPIASKVSYMTAIGNHERDFIRSGSVYWTPDSGGEIGVPYETYFQMPTQAKDKPWYSIEQGSVHFTIMSSEHEWKVGSEQFKWMSDDMASVDRSKTPWLVFVGHRPMYSSTDGTIVSPSVDSKFVNAVEPLLLERKVDLVLVGHVHNYERTCAVYNKQCKAMPKKDEHGVDTFNTFNYKAPIHAIIGMAGFSLDGFSSKVKSWSLKRISEYGYTRVHATRDELKLEFVNAKSRNVEDSFRIIKRSYLGGMNKYIEQGFGGTLFQTILVILVVFFGTILLKIEQGFGRTLFQTVLVILLVLSGTILFKMLWFM